MTTGSVLEELGRASVSSAISCTGRNNDNIQCLRGNTQTNISRGRCSPGVRSMKDSVSRGTAMPMALLIPYTLLTSQGATWLVIPAKFSVTFSAVIRASNADIGHFVTAVTRNWMNGEFSGSTKQPTIQVKDEESNPLWSGIRSYIWECSIGWGTFYWFTRLSEEPEETASWEALTQLQLLLSWGQQANHVRRLLSAQTLLLCFLQVMQEPCSLIQFLLDTQSICDKRGIWHRWVNVSSGYLTLTPHPPSPPVLGCICGTQCIHSFSSLHELGLCSSEWWAENKCQQDDFKSWWVKDSEKLVFV